MVLTATGTFGPILHTVQAFLQTVGGFTWKRWENNGLNARRYSTLALLEIHRITLAGAAFPRVSGTILGSRPLVTGKIAIDPRTGAILRVEFENDLSGFVPTRRSDILVSYGP